MKSSKVFFPLWGYVNQDKKIPPLRVNHTIAQIKQHGEETMKKEKVVSCLHSTLENDVYTCIMHLKKKEK